MLKEKVECRICGSQEYQVRRESGGPVRYGGPAVPKRVVGYSCADCGSNFDGPQKMNKPTQTEEEG